MRNEAKAVMAASNHTIRLFDINEGKQIIQMTSTRVSNNVKF